MSDIKSGSKKSDIGQSHTKAPGGAHWAKMGLIIPHTPFPSEISIYSKVKQIAIFEKYNILCYQKRHLCSEFVKNWRL